MPETRSDSDRFPLPHQFQPRLSLYGALIAITAALARIFLVSGVGALWGVGIWYAADSKMSLLLKIPVIFLAAVGMFTSIAGLLRGIHLLVEHLTPPVPHET